MLALISPAKNLDFETEPMVEKYTVPNLLEETEILVNTVRKLSRGELAQTMSISQKLADLNFKRYQDFSIPFHLGNSKQAAFVFNGDTYAGLQVNSLSKSNLIYAQKHLRILSGLYGILRPLDLIQPYRLEMGLKFKTLRGKNLYEFWKDRITDTVNNALEEHTNNTVINLASSEYFKVIKMKKLAGPLVTPIFKEIKGSEIRTVGMFAKKARGAMARYMITNQIDQVDELKDFNINGYSYRDDLSSGTDLVFSRVQPKSNS